MKSLILITATRVLMPMLLLLSAFLLFRGHNQPGGGFIGGLVAASTFILHCFAHGPEETRKLLRVQPGYVVAVGLLLAMGSGCLSLMSGMPFMTGLWGDLELGGGQHLPIGTPVIFDIGVYLVVIGAMLEIVLTLAEEG